ncbi:MAG: hypothetical protein ABSC77_05610 [Terracidiphilus sp.]|jgi:hypothetical protein
MRQSIMRFHSFPVIFLFVADLFCSGAVSVAQNSDFKLELHANKHATAVEIGLPAYPGAILAKETDEDNTADLGFTFGDTHFRIMVAKYITTDTPESVLAFYRKPLTRYGDVLECNGGKPVGRLTVTKSGLGCSEQKEGGLTVTDHGLSSGGHELRVGSPHQFRIVCIDESHPQSTRFWLVYIELPKDHDKNER